MESQLKMFGFRLRGLSQQLARSTPRSSQLDQRMSAVGSLSLRSRPINRGRLRFVSVRRKPSWSQHTLSPWLCTIDLAVASNDDTKAVGGGFDGAGNAMPAEMLPATIKYHGVEFKLGPAKTGVPNAVVAQGQTIALPAGRFNRIYVLAAATDGDQTASFRVGSEKVELKIQDWSGFIGQWDTRIWNIPAERDWAISANHAVWPPADEKEREQRPIAPRYPEDYVGLKAGYVKTASLAWYASHHHTAAGLNQPYEYSYLFAYPIEVDWRREVDYASVERQDSHSCYFDSRGESVDRTSPATV